MAQRTTGKELLEKKLTEINRKLANAEETVKTYKQQKAEYERKINDIKIKELSELMDQRGLSVDDICSLIDNKDKKETTEE